MGRIQTNYFDQDVSICYIGGQVIPALYQAKSIVFSLKRKKKQQYLSSCKALVQPIVRAFCVCLIQRKGGIFLIFFLHKKNIFHYYSKGYAVVGKKLLDSAKWLMHIGYFCSKWSYKWYWKPLLSSKYLGETPVNHNV